MNIIKNIKLRSNKSFENYFKTDDKLALDFLKKSLTFNHKNRLTIDEALEHPFLENFRESDDYQILNKVVEIPIDENTRFSTSVYQEALYNEIIRKKKEQRRKWKEEYLKSLRLETKDKSDTQNQITKKESRQIGKKEQKKNTKVTEEPQETEKKPTGGTLTEIQPDSKQESVLLSKDKSEKKNDYSKNVQAHKNEKKSRNLNNGSTHKRPKKGFFPRNNKKKVTPQEKQKNGFTYENEIIKKEKRSETPTVFMRKKSPEKEFTNNKNHKKSKDQRDAFKRRKSAYEKGKILFKEKKVQAEDSKMDPYTRNKKINKKKEKLLKKVSRPKNSNSSGKSLAAFTSKRNHLKYSRGLLTHNFKKNNGQNNFQALFASKSKQREGSMGMNNYMSNSRKNVMSKNRNFKDSRKIQSQLKSSPKGSNPYIKPNGSRHSEMIFNQNAMRFHPPNYGVYANERQRFLSRFDGVFKSNNQKESYKKSHDKSKLAKHYSSLNAYEKNFYRGSLQGKDSKSGTLYNGHIKPKRSLKMGSSHKEKHGNVKLTKFRSREKVSGVGFSYRNVNQPHSQYDNSMSKNIYEDNLYSGISGGKMSRKFNNEGNQKRHVGSLIGGHLFMKSKNKSRKNVKRSPVRMNSKIANRNEFKRSEDLWMLKGGTKDAMDKKEFDWRSKKKVGREGLQERDRNRKKQTRGELENKVTLLYRNLIKQEKQ
jgi:hypothetical protein